MTKALLGRLHARLIREYELGYKIATGGISWLTAPLGHPARPEQLAQ